jgi:hypothetical protein
MGVRDLWALVQKKGHDPPVATIPQEVPNGKLRVDVQGTLFSLIRRAYSNHDDEAAHRIFLHDLNKLFRPAGCVLYFDGQRAQEKSRVHTQRDEVRKTSMAKATKLLGQLDDRTQQNQKISRQMHIDIKKTLGQCFAWSQSSKDGLCALLRSQGWIVKLCTTEADVGIASDCTPEDIVVTRDSDMLAYQKVMTIMRPTRGNKALVYDVHNVLQSIGLSREQLTTLAVISTNDYSRNIPTLGCATNFGIVKRLNASGKNSIHVHVTQAHFRVGADTNRLLSLTMMM